MTVKSVNGILPNENGELTLPMQPGPKGDPGDRGLTGSRGITGATGQPGQPGRDGIDGYTPVKGVDYFDGEPGRDGIDGKDGKNGLDGSKGEPGINGLNGKDGDPGIDGVDGKDGLNGKDGEPGIILYNSNGLINEPVKSFADVATVTGSDGRFTLDISSAEFTIIDSVQMTVQAGSFSQAEAPLSANYNNVTSTNLVINGKAFKATSAGLLAAMQQTPAESGTKINVLVIGR